MNQSIKNFLYGNLVGCGILVFFALVEVVLRLFGFYFSTTPRYMEFNFPNTHELHRIFEPDPVMLWRLRPGVSMGEGIEPINSRGFRGGEFDEARPAGKIRVITIGDSVTFGAQYSYPRFMAECLGEDYQVINAGVPGYSSLQGLRLFESRLTKLNPDIIVVLFSWNDHWLAMGHTDAEQTMNHAPVELGAEPLYELRLYQFVRWLVFKLGGGGDLSGPPRLRVSIDEYGENLEALITSARENRSKVILMTAPSGLSLGKLPRYLYHLRFIGGSKREPEEEGVAKLKELHSEYNDVVRDIAKYPGRAILVDLDVQWGERGVEDLFSFPEDDIIHPNEKGYRLMANTLCDTIRQIAFEVINDE